MEKKKSMQSSIGYSENRKVHSQQNLFENVPCFISFEETLNFH